VRAGRPIFLNVFDDRLYLEGGNARVEDNQFPETGGPGVYVDGSGADLTNNVFSGPCTF